LKLRIKNRIWSYKIIRFGCLFSKSLSPFIEHTERYKKWNINVTGRETDRLKEGQTDRQTNSETRGQTDRQIDKHAERQTQRQIDKIKHFFTKWITIEIAIFFKERFKYLISSTLMPKLELTFQEGLIINGMKIEKPFSCYCYEKSKIVYYCKQNVPL
jgi:hypothetical protein